MSAIPFRLTTPSTIPCAESPNQPSSSELVKEGAGPQKQKASKLPVQCQPKH